MELQNKTTTEVILMFFTPPVGALIAAMVSTFGKLQLWNGPSVSLVSPGIYFIASFLYVSYLLFVVEPCANQNYSETPGICFPASSNICAWHRVSRMSSMFMHSVTCMT